LHDIAAVGVTSQPSAEMPLLQFLAPVAVPPVKLLLDWLMIGEAQPNSTQTPEVINDRRLVFAVVPLLQFISIGVTI
jgi:hypothetical protein